MDNRKGPNCKITFLRKLKKKIFQKLHIISLFIIIIIINKFVLHDLNQIIGFTFIITCFSISSDFPVLIIPKILKSLQSNTVPEYILGLKKLKDCIISYFDQIFSNIEMQFI